MRFRTEVDPPRGLQGLVKHDTPILLVGSCFSDNIGDLLRRDLFDVTVNPFGPLYNPASIEHAVTMLTLGQGNIVETDLFEHGGLWHSFDFHSRYSRHDREETLSAMNASLVAAREAMLGASVLILTLGTTRVFRLRHDERRVVANCHKLPGTEFEEQKLSLDECERSLLGTIDAARAVNPRIKVVVTVSPLRYLGHGAHDNSIIKSTLILAVDRVERQCEGIYYFPAYEIMMDDLRDYRFYADDLKHPSSQAVTYIYEKFSQAYFTPATQALADEAAALTRRLDHKSMGIVNDSTCSELSKLVENFKTAHPLLRSAVDNYLTDRPITL